MIKDARLEWLYRYVSLGPGFGIWNTPDRLDQGVHWTEGSAAVDQGLKLGVAAMDSSALSSSAIGKVTVMGGTANVSNSAAVAGEAASGVVNAAGSAKSEIKSKPEK